MTNFFQRFFNFRRQDHPKTIQGNTAMDEIHQRLQRAAESILENEALTTNLDDDTAKILLAWGVEQARIIASKTTELEETQAEEAMYAPMRALRKMLSAVSNWVLNPQEGDLEKILQQAAIVYGSSPDADAQEKFFSALSGNPIDRINALKNWLDR